MAGGSAYSYFGHDDWAPYAPELKSLEGALDLRARILTAFEAAEVETDEERRQAWLTFVVVGAGPTGVEMAGQIAEIARDTLRRDFRAVDTRTARVLLVEAGDRVLAAFPSACRGRAARSLERLGVTPMLRTTVVGVAADARRGAGSRRLARDDRGAIGRSGRQGSRPRRSPACWRPRRAAKPTARGASSSSPTSRCRAIPEVFAAGDMVAVRTADGGTLPLPGVAPVAMQQGRHIARVDPRPASGARSATSTRATSRRSAAHARSPTSRACS